MRHPRLVPAAKLVAEPPPSLRREPAQAAFTATAPDVVRAVSFTGYVSTTDPATGKSARPCLVTVTAERPVFEDLVLADVEPAACLAGLI